MRTEKKFNVYYRNLRSKRLCRYSTFAIDWVTALMCRESFNDNRNNREHGEAWIDLHNLPSPVTVGGQGHFPTTPVRRPPSPLVIVF